MIQVYKYPNKELYIIKDTIPDMVFMDITKEQAKEILKVYKREHRDRLGGNAINANEFKLDEYDTVYKGVEVENYIKLAKIMRGDKEMSKRFYYDEFSDDIFDEQIDDYPSNFEICEILNKQQRQIEELEQKLSELKETKAQELADYLKMSLPQYINQEKISFCVEQLDCIRKTISDNTLFVSEDGKQMIGIHISQHICDLINKIKGVDKK